MPRYFFGKFDSNRPDQIENLYYAAGQKGSSWYGGIEEGDYVFPIAAQKVLGIWRVKEYTKRSNPINLDDDGVVIFEKIKTYNVKPTVTSFIRSPYFDLSINLLNKISKSTLGFGFFELNPTPAMPQNPQDIEFNKVRNIYITIQAKLPNLVEDDVVVIINNLQETRIDKIQIYKNGKLIDYLPLKKLYEEKNLPNERYSLQQLLVYGKAEAPNKARYIEAVLQELQSSGYFLVVMPIQLYDNILVGRRKTPKSKNSENVPIIDDVEDLEDLSPYQEFADLLDFNPNLILYGPPGTGKTFATKKIIEAYEEKHSGQRIKFQQVEHEKRVKFITFHQSYSYEEFIEGIRPKLTQDDNEGEIKYQIQDGILKELVQSASTQSLKAEKNLPATELISNKSTVWKVSLGLRSDDSAYNMCKAEQRIGINWLEDTNFQGMDHDAIYSTLQKEREEGAPKPTKDALSINSFVNEMEIGDIVFIYDGPYSIRDIGVVKSSYEYLQGKSYPHSRQVVWLKEFDTPADISVFNSNKRLTLQTVYKLDRIQMSDVHRLLRDVKDEDAQNQLKTSEKEKPYYLIIDEINRGNISKIFGELMTLLEKDKRDALTVNLPYSQKPFTLPKNLFLIGTMNTTDRSIALLDTALRRRFAFVEIEPNYNVFQQTNDNAVPTIQSINLESLLRTLNERISTALDRDHRIGHAYLMDIFTIDDLYKAWYYKILPLIADYFYNDTKLIQSIVGDAFMSSNGSFQFLNRRGKDMKPSEFEQAINKIYSSDEEE